MPVITEFCTSCGSSFPPRPGEGTCKDWEKCRDKQIGDKNGAR